MIKGWRNDPRWVEYYERKQAQKVEKQIERMRSNARSDQAIKEMARHRQNSSPPRAVDFNLGY